MEMFKDDEYKLDLIARLGRRQSSLAMSRAISPISAADRT